jgi:hypothetical protein
VQSLQFHTVAPEMKLGVAYGLLYQILRSARRHNAVPQFLRELEHFIRRKANQFPELKDAILAGHRSDGKGVLFPRSTEPFKLGRRKFREAITEIELRQKVI